MNPKQARFVQEYLKDLDSKQAAIRAGYSEKTAAQAGSRMVKELSIDIASAMAKRQDRVEVTQDQVIQELSKMAFAKLYDPTEWGPKIRALELIGKHLGMFSERQDITLRVERPLKELTDEELDANVQT